MMPDQPLVSVIIPLYNTGLYIEQCIRSILAQTWPDIEVIIVDDGSTDNSFEIAKKFEGEKVKLLKQPNSGASIARNTGLRIAKGEYIQFMDADDLLSPNKIEEQVKRLKSHPSHVAVCATAYFDNDADPYQAKPVDEWYTEGSNDPADFLIKLYGGTLIGPAYGGMVQPNAWLTPAHIIKKAGDWNEMRNPDDDGEFFCRVLLESEGIVFADKAVNYYRKAVNQQSLSGRNDYVAFKNTLEGTFLKRDHLLAKTNRPEARLAMSLLFWKNAQRCYPIYKDLSARAEKAARELAPDFRFMPYQSSSKAIIAKLFGWKLVRAVQHINIKFRRNFKK
ncbi:MAG TPA: glycosyltransferase [Mucilaginibacter sp.]|jgi:glycosyltransferase involved in cell wall biosynthesis